MKTAFCLVGCVLLVVCGLAPYGFGIRTEQTLTALVQLGAAAWDVPMYTTRYTRGWFCSTAETFLALPPDVVAVLRPYLVQTPAATPEGLTIAHHIRHGPFPLALRPGGALSLFPVQTIITSSLAPAGFGAFRGVVPAAVLPALQVSTTIFLHGAGQGHVVVPAFVYPPGAPAEAWLVWEGLHGDVTVSVNGEHLAGSLRTPGLQFAGEEGEFALRDVVTRTEVFTGHQQSGRSDTSVRVGGLEVTRHSADQSSSWAMTGAEVRAATTIGGATLQTVVDMQLDTLHLAQMPYGPGTSHLELHRLHLPTLATLLREVMTQAQNAPDLTTLWLRLLLSGELARLLSEFARTQPEIALTQARLRTTEGEIRASVQMRLDGSRLGAPGYLLQLLQALDVRATGEAPASWVRAMVIAQVSKAMRARHTMAAALPPSVLDWLAAPISDRYLHSLVEQEYLVLDGDTYRSTARYSHGQLLVNGQLLHLPGLLP